MKINPLFGQGIIEENSYVIEDESSGEIAIIDPGFASMDTVPQLDNLKYILLTHGHFDHILMAEEIRKKYGGEICIYQDDSEMLKAPSLNLSNQFGLMLSFAAQKLVKANEIISLGETEIKIIHTPGHTSGSCCYYIEKANVMFTGDTIFADSIGRTDFPTGSIIEMKNSIELLDKMNINPVVYPGHGHKEELRKALRFAKMFF